MHFERDEAVPFNLAEEIAARRREEKEKQRLEGAKK
jgi:hypothetical protein